MGASICCLNCFILLSFRYGTLSLFYRRIADFDRKSAPRGSCKVLRYGFFCKVQVRNAIMLYKPKKQQRNACEPPKLTQSFPAAAQHVALAFTTIRMTCNIQVMFKDGLK